MLGTRYCHNLSTWIQALSINQYGLLMNAAARRKFSGSAASWLVGSKFLGCSDNQAGRSKSVLLRLIAASDGAWALDLPKE
jgi:hypothetical protein